jgi:hypothetical protein
MAGLDPVIHVLLRLRRKDVDARDIWREDALLPGHNEKNEGGAGKPAVVDGSFAT